MAWLKDAYLDVVILLLVALFAVYTNAILEVILWVYSGLLLLSKILAFFMPSLQRKAHKTDAPLLFYHIIYALTVIIFFYIGKYYLGTVWCIIWITSLLSITFANKK